MAHPEENLKNELHQEFQVERMILFSDAVFAIVITLMAIEIHIPETTPIQSASDLHHALLHLLPTLFAYLVSFSFIGAIWYQHLKIFGFLKAYDAKLVFLNLMLLLFVGLFPFSAALISKNSDVSPLPFFIYMAIIIACLGALTLIEHYVFIKKPEFKNKSDISDMLKKHQDRKEGLLILSIIITLVIVFYFVFKGTYYEPFTTSIFALHPVIYWILKKRRERRR